MPIWSADDQDSEFATAPAIGRPERDALPDFDLTVIGSEAESDAAG